ncbi:MAG: DUF1932 domain-containing protein [Pseudomonadota bacterium]
MPTVGILSTGDMGAAVGRELRAHGAHVLTNLDGRSRRTRDFAAAAGIEDVGSDTALVDAADLILSITVPAAAVALADRLAPALAAAATRPVVVDCNAIAPATVATVGAIVEAAGARFVDAAIIGPPPSRGAELTRFYASGVDTAAFVGLADHGLDVRAMGARVGDASALKMCYAALTKGSAALIAQLLMAAERLGVGDTLEAEMAVSQGPELQRAGGRLTNAIPKAFRWIAEMEEIASTFASVDLTPKTFEGAADLYRHIAATELGQVKVEAFAERGLDRRAMVKALAAEPPA